MLTKHAYYAAVTGKSPRNIKVLLALTYLYAVNVIQCGTLSWPVVVGSIQLGYGPTSKSYLDGSTNTRLLIAIINQCLPLVAADGILVSFIL